MAVEVVPGTVVTSGRARIRVPGGVLDVSEAGTGIEGERHALRRRHLYLRHG